MDRIQLAKTLADETFFRNQKLIKDRLSRIIGLFAKRADFFLGGDARKLSEHEPEELFRTQKEKISSEYDSLIGEAKNLLLAYYMIEKCKKCPFDSSNYKKIVFVLKNQLKELLDEINYATMSYEFENLALKINLTFQEDIRKS